jgi:prenyltransferase beta subunit
MTYAAVVVLLTLGDNLERVDRKRVMKGLVALQNPDGR